MRQTAIFQVRNITRKCSLLTHNALLKVTFNFVKSLLLEPILSRQSFRELSDLDGLKVKRKTVTYIWLHGDYKCMDAWFPHKKQDDCKKKFFLREWNITTHRICLHVSPIFGFFPLWHLSFTVVVILFSRWAAMFWPISIHLYGWFLNLQQRCNLEMIWKVLETDRWVKFQQDHPSSSYCNRVIIVNIICVKSNFAWTRCVA